MDYQRFRQGADAARRYPDQSADQSAGTAGRSVPINPHYPLPATATTVVRVDCTLPGDGGRSVDIPPSPSRALSEPSPGRGRHRRPRKPLMRWWPWRAA